MNISLKKISNPSDTNNRIHIYDHKKELKQILSSKSQLNYSEKNHDIDDFFFFDGESLTYLIKGKASGTERAEQLRKSGYTAWQQIKKIRCNEIMVSSAAPEDCLHFIEGLLLSTYQFDKYISKNSPVCLKKIKTDCPFISQKELDELKHICLGNFIARDLVNEPPVKLTSTSYSKEIIALGKEYGFKTEVFEKNKIEALKMGGLLAVNLGSEIPPTFNILEWKPKKCNNKKPFVLVGKGVVYDTGGLSLKPTANSMDLMKSDMAGSASVVGTICAIAKMKLPIHVIGLIAATDNRPGKNAYAPGDIIHMHDGKTVEVLNTDAEGRMTLADALSYAKKYDPELVIDIATLTGAAARAIGQAGLVYMGTASSKTKKSIEAISNQVYERLVEFPLWDEYGDDIKSEIADLKNIGGPSAGHITAGKFLEAFTDYPWLHIDIAGTAFLTSEDFYKGKHATGSGVRLLTHFLKAQI